MDRAMTMLADVPLAEASLREALSRSDAAHAAIGPILRHLLTEHDQALFTDEIVTRVRGTIRHLAEQLVAGSGTMPGSTSTAIASEVDALAETLLLGEPLVRHCHALALEWQLSVRLERSGIDPVLSPLLQALIASDDEATAGVAMAALTAQARFIQQQRRMELPLDQLPADRFDGAISDWLNAPASQADDAAETAAAVRRRGYDEASTRLALFARLVEAMGPGARAALSLAHAGPALFPSAVAAAVRCDRQTIVVAASEHRTVRLALALRAAGLSPGEAEEQLAYLQPDGAQPDGLAELGSERAAAILAGASASSSS